VKELGVNVECDYNVEAEIPGKELDEVNKQLLKLMIT